MPRVSRPSLSLAVPDLGGEAHEHWGEEPLPIVLDAAAEADVIAEVLSTMMIDEIEALLKALIEPTG